MNFVKNDDGPLFERGVEGFRLFELSVNRRKITVEV
jgi:hypothetical protein